MPSCCSLSLVCWRTAVVRDGSGSPGRKTGWFAAAGNLGWAVAPLILPVLIQVTGFKEAATWMLLPGLLATGVLVWGAGGGALSNRQAGAQGAVAATEAVRAVPQPIRLGRHQATALLPVVALVALRSWANFGLVAMLPLYLSVAGVNLIGGNRRVSILLLAGTIGGILGGYLADRVGKRKVIIVSLLLATPAFFLVTAFPGSWSYLFLTLAGGLLLMSFPLTVVLAQERLPQHLGYASGMVLGLAAGLGSLGLTLSGWMGDRFGLRTVVWFLSSLPALAGGIAALMHERSAVHVRPHAESV